MNNTVKIILLIVGGYVIYRYMQPAAAAAPTIPSTPTDPHTQPAAPAPTAPPDLSITRALLAAWATTVPSYATAGTLSGYEWTWGYNKVRGANLQDTGYPDGSIQVTLDEFLANAQAHSIGLQGLAGDVARIWGAHAYR